MNRTGSKAAAVVGAVLWLGGAGCAGPAQIRSSEPLGEGDTVWVRVMTESPSGFSVKSTIFLCKAEPDPICRPARMEGGPAVTAADP